MITSILTTLTASLQIGPDEALRKAGQYARVLDRPFDATPESVERHERVISVSFGADELIVLTFRGDLVSYSRLERALEADIRGTPRFRSDSDAFIRAQEVMEQFDCPPNLTPRSVEWRPYPSRVGSFVNSISCYFVQNPHGYATSVGNHMIVGLHPRTGQVLSLSMLADWNYEQPNIRVTTSEARGIAEWYLGHSVQGWHTDLEWFSHDASEVPPEVRTLYAAKKSRLCYFVKSAAGAVVIIDSTNGDVVRHMVPASIPSPVPFGRYYAIAAAVCHASGFAAVSMRPLSRYRVR
ncbi:MAG: hypothetical protein ABL949_05330 [Fimbriimonadaceae bacterium]